MTTKNRMFGKMLTSRLLKIMSITIVACMLVITMTACGTVSQQDIRPTVEHSTEAGEGYEPDNPEQNIDDGYWHDEDPTEEPSSTEEPTTEPTTETNDGTYTYYVNEIPITLRTHIEDYIYTNSVGTYGVDLVSLATSLGYHYEGLHPDEPELQVGFYLDSNSDYFVYFTDDDNWNFTKVETDTRGNRYWVSFTRNDVDNDAETTYWVFNGGNTGRYKVNFEQIVIFTFMLENGCYAPTEDWLANTYLTRVTDTQYVVDK